tara:strand:- start:2918 stop:3094 length:177 start_codon:yes stop_codon:yes gene_type:complete
MINAILAASRVAMLRQSASQSKFCGNDNKKNRPASTGQARMRGRKWQQTAKGSQRKWR